MFRQEAIDHHQSPDELDRLLVVVTPKAWFILATLTTVCALGLTWAIVGRIPVRVDGFGVLVNPGNVESLQSPAVGQITAVEVRIGQHIEQNEVIAQLDQPELRKELEQLQGQRRDKLAFHKTAVELDRQRRDLETESYQRQRTFVEKEMTASKELSEKLDERGETFTEVQRRNLEKTRQLTAKLNAALKERLETLQQLKLEGLSSQDLVLSAETQMADSETRIADLEVQVQEMELSEIQRERSQLEQANRLSDLTLDLMRLDIAAQRLVQELTHNQEQRTNELLEIDNAIDRVKLRLERESRILSDAAGTVLEVSVQPGQVVGLGTRVGTIEMDNPGAVLTNLSFFSVRDGKRITPGDIARVTPSTVNREREGSILGTVRSVSAFPVTQESVVNDVGNAHIASELMQLGGAIEVEIELEADEDSYSGYRWTSKGPEKTFSAGTTTTVRVTIDERAPITYLLPILRTWLFGDKDERTPEN